MTEALAEARPAYSRDHWDIVLSQLARRPSVWVSVVLLALAYAAAIYAPLLAGDRPLVITATDAAAYNAHLKTLVPIVINFEGLVTGGEAAHAASRSTLGWPETLAAERDAIALRATGMRDRLAPADRGVLDELLGRLARAHDAARPGAAGDPAAVAEAQAVVALARRAKAELQPAAAGAAPEPGRTVALQAHTTWPAFAAIARSELYFMGLWLLVLLWPLWNLAVNRLVLRGDREAIRRARRGKLAALVLIPLLPLPFWSGGDEDALSSSPYKAGLTSGEIVPQSVVFPPIPFGPADISDGEYLRPPTWHRDSEINAAGYYARGARAEITTGDSYRPPPKKVEVLLPEPARNAAGRHWLGTDSLGRDMLARMIWGGRVSLSVGLVSTVFLVVLGVLLGALAGYYGGRVDALISRVIEVFQCFPTFFLILIIVAFVGPSLTIIMVVLGVTRWPGVARLVRGEFLRLREQDFVVASEALGMRQRRTIFRHVLPNAMGPVLVAATFSVASGILIESALSYLGFGSQLPVPSWGSLLIESRAPQDWWIQIFPGLVIFLTVVLYNLLGEGVADALDPRQQKL